MRRGCILLISILSTGCSATAVVENEVPPSDLQKNRSVRVQVPVLSRTPVSFPLKGGSPGPGEKKLPSAVTFTNFAAPIKDAKDGKTGRYNPETVQTAKRPDALEARDEKAKADENSAPSPHDISLPVPEIEKNFDPLPKQAAKAPKAFLYDVPVVRNTIVDRWIEYFTGPGRTTFSLWLSRSGRYIKMFREILRERGLPQDLAYLALIESGFSLKARSRAGAVGPWQFMPSTARMMGLKINFYVDERRHPIKSTRAASKYLAELYAKFGDWHLALAGYNAGENRIFKAMRGSRKKDYWSLVRTRYLPRETRHYVAKYLAGMIIAKNPEVFGFVGVRYDAPWDYQTVLLPNVVNLRKISRVSNVSLRALREINAELRTSITPPIKGYRIFLPNGDAKKVVAKLARLPKEYLVARGHYRIQRGDTFDVIARRFRIPLPNLLEMNAHLQPRKLRPGTKLILPKPIRSRRVLQRKPAPRNGKLPNTHIVQRGESFWRIAQKYNVSTRQLTRLNPKLRPKRIRVGMKIHLPSKRGFTKAKRVRKTGNDKTWRHLVGRGENIWLIAKRYGVSSKSLLLWNQLDTSAKIFPGNTLIIRR